MMTTSRFYICALMITCVSTTKWNIVFTSRIGNVDRLNPFIKSILRFIRAQHYNLIESYGHLWYRILYRSHIWVKWFDVFTEAVLKFYQKNFSSRYSKQYMFLTIPIVLLETRDVTKCVEKITPQQVPDPHPDQEWCITKSYYIL